MPDLCDVAVEQRDGPTVVRLVGELDMSNAAAIAAELGEALGGAANGVLQLDDLDYVDSAGLAALERVLRVHPVPVVLADDATIRETLSVAGFDKVRAMYATLADVPDD